MSDIDMRTMPTAYFIQKGEFFIEQLSAMELVPFHCRDFSDDFYAESLEEWHEDFFALMSELKNIENEMKLMFSAFDQGAYFLAKLSDFVPENQDVSKNYLCYLIKINEMFIEFLYG